jgi:hypothetical protein
VTDQDAARAEPALDGRVRRQVGRMADGRRITYYSWLAGEDDAPTPGGREAGDEAAGGP